MYFEDFFVGQKFTLSPVTFSREEILSFGKSYDPQLLHTDEAYAAATSFGDLIASGFQTHLALWNRVLEAGVFGEGLVAGKSCRISWCAPVFAGDVLSAVCTVSGRMEGEGRGTVEFTLEAKNQKNETVLISVTEAVMHRRP